MEWIINRRKELSFSWLEIKATRVGDDILAWICGGDKPHIGCTVQAIPRPSLSGDGSVSVTSSVINVTGHKDEDLCRKVAETLCKKYNTITVCAGGFHMDDISMRHIVEVIQAVEEIVST